MSSRSVCVIGSGWRFTSGISYYTWRLASALSQQDRVSVILMRRLIPRRLYPGRARVGQHGFARAYPADVPVFDGIDWYWIPSLIAGIRFLYRERPEVVVFQWWTGAVLHSYIVLGFVARRLGARVVIEFHETQDTGEARLRGAAHYVRAIGRRFFSLAAGYIVHSEFDRIEISRSLRLDGRPLAVIPLGPFDHHVTDGRADDSSSSDESEFVMLFFGTIRPYKGLEFLIEAFDGLTDDEASRLKLLVVGETWEGWTKPLELIDTNRHRNRIELVNRYVADAEIGSFFNRADAVVLPYIRSSASGPLHIAMAHGLPVIVSDVGGLRDGAEGYDGVQWVSPGDVEELRGALRELPDQRGERFSDPRSWKRTAEAFDELFDVVLGSPQT